MHSTPSARPVVEATTLSRPAGPPPPQPAVFTPSNADRDLPSFQAGPLLVTTSTSRRGRSRTPPRSVPSSEPVDVEANDRADRRIDAGVEIDRNTGNEAIRVDNEVNATASVDPNIMSAIDASIDALFQELNDDQPTLNTPVLDVLLSSHIGLHLEMTTTAISGSEAGLVPTPLGGPLPEPLADSDCDYVSDTACDSNA